jgi:hypothetical protein
MPMDQLIREHDVQAKTTVMGVNYYLEEVARRDAEAQGARMEQAGVRMEQMTKTIRTLTWAIFVFTAVSTVAILWDVFGSHR